MVFLTCDFLFYRNQCVNCIVLTRKDSVHAGIRYVIHASKFRKPPHLFVAVGLLLPLFFFVPVIPENGDQVLGRLFPQLPWGHISAGFPLPHFRSKLRRSQVVNTGDCQVDLSPITSYDHGIIIIESLLGQRKSSYWTILLQVAM